jgi:hypothetical protein
MKIQIRRIGEELALRVDTQASFHADAMRIVDKLMVDYAETFKALAKT